MYCCSKSGKRFDMGKTSSAVKQRYNEKAYTQVSTRLKKDLVSAWEGKLAADGITKAEFMRGAIQRYLCETAPLE
jgi:conjugal transfer/entry exclusion protein